MNLNDIMFDRLFNTCFTGLGDIRSKKAASSIPYFIGNGSFFGCRMRDRFFFQGIEISHIFGVRGLPFANLEEIQMQKALKSPLDPLGHYD